MQFDEKAGEYCVDAGRAGDQCSCPPYIRKNYRGEYIVVPITKTQVYAKGDGKNTIGYAHITIGDTYVVKNLRVVKGKKGVFVGMPSNKSRRGDYIDVFFPITQEARIYLTKTVIEAFQNDFPDLMAGLTVYGISNEDYKTETEEAS